MKKVVCCFSCLLFSSCRQFGAEIWIPLPELELENSFPVRHPEVASRISASLSFYNRYESVEAGFCPPGPNSGRYRQVTAGKGKGCHPRGCHFGVSFGRLGIVFARGEGFRQASRVAYRSEGFRVVRPKAWVIFLFCFEMMMTFFCHQSPVISARS